MLSPIIHEVVAAESQLVLRSEAPLRRVASAQRQPLSDCVPPTEIEHPIKNNLDPNAKNHHKDRSLRPPRLCGKLFTLKRRQEKHHLFEVALRCNCFSINATFPEFHILREHPEHRLKLRGHLLKLCGGQGAHLLFKRAK